MSKLRIVFLGTPEFAAHVLEELVLGAYHIVGVVTTPDRPAGRGHRLTPSAVKETAVRLLPDAPIFQPESLKDPDFLEALKALDADLFIVVAFRMLPKEVWSMPRKGTFNLHASLLPNYRGAAPIQRAIMNGEKETGVTTFFLNEKIDEGLIILREKVEITPEDNGGTLHDKLLSIGSKLVLKTVDMIEIDGCSGTPQIVPEGMQIHQADKIFKQDRLLHFQSWDAERIHQWIRGLSPYPTAIATMIGRDGNRTEIKIFKAKISDDLPHLQPGAAMIRDGHIYIRCMSGTVELLEIQYPSKKRTKTADFLRGNPLEHEEVYFL